MPAEWNLMSNPGHDDVPEVADFLGISKSGNQSELVPYNDIQLNDTEYLFSNNSLVPVQHTTNYDLQENPHNMQSLTLSMGNGKGSTSETLAIVPAPSADNSNTSIVEATPRRTLDTFGQRTSIYRGVTR